MIHMSMYANDAKTRTDRDAGYDLKDELGCIWRDVGEEDIR